MTTTVILSKKKSAGMKSLTGMVSLSLKVVSIFFLVVLNTYSTFLMHNSSKTTGTNNTKLYRII